MSPIPNPHILYAKLPEALPVPGEHLIYEADAETIDLENAPLNGGILAKLLYLSVDPYMRGRMRDPSIPSYSAPFDVGSVPFGGSVSKVLRSESPKYKVGDYVHIDPTPWRAYSIYPEDKAGTIIDNPQGLPWSTFLGVAGMPGETAFYSTKKYADFKKGDTIFVSTAAGAVGSVVVQLAKLNGLKVIGSTGDDSKLEYLREIGVDVPFNYKKESVWDILKANGPIDIYFDNVGGEQLDAALLYARDYARFLMCGYASSYNNEETYGIKNMDLILRKTLHVQGFLVFRLRPLIGKDVFVKEFLPLVHEGKVKYQEDRVFGLDKVPEALLRLLKGQNKGKAIVVVAED
ncbi:alcohol dehydrogenase [Clavulina sp. PMI_390]|nr:alcohol dehydrogenase [Clavulina sp. PMI_390]